MTPGDAIADLVPKLPDVRELARNVRLEIWFGVALITVWLAYLVFKDDDPE
jgi:hypothetical protein